MKFELPDYDASIHADPVVDAPRSYDPAAVASAVSVIRRAVCEDSAGIIAAILALRSPGGPNLFDVLRIGEAAGLENDLEAVWDHLDTVDRAFRDGLGVRLMTISDTTSGRRRTNARGKGHEPNIDVTSGPPRTITLSDELSTLLDKPYPVPAVAELPVPDARTASWVSTLQAVPVRGHHLALRVHADGREVADFAGLVAAAGARVNLVLDASPATPANAIFRAELHASERGHIVVVGRDVLVRPSASSDVNEDDEYTEASISVLTIGAPTTSALSWLSGLRNTYVWRISASGELPRELDGFLGGCIGPVAFDRAWSESVIAAMTPGIDSKGAAALLAQVRDPRDAGAMTAMVETVANGTATTLDEACKFVARSFGARAGGLIAGTAPPAFDPRLLVSDHDLGVFFDRADALSRNGGRLLLWGPPGGGKSSLALALARQMVGVPTIVVAPADILAHRWGAMERRLAALWSRAATEGAALVVDELDSLCASRDRNSNNNYLIRCLTDEWLRGLDAHPSVPILATVNDPLAVDDAIRRRFAFVVKIDDELTPDREQRAWASILGLEPPPGWTPCGASVADVALAKTRCRMLGLNGPASLADATVRARDARLGSVAKRRPKTSGSLH